MNSRNGREILPDPIGPELTGCKKTRQRTAGLEVGDRHSPIALGWFAGGSPHPDLPRIPEFRIYMRWLPCPNSG